MVTTQGNKLGAYYLLNPAKYRVLQTITFGQTEDADGSPTQSVSLVFGQSFGKARLLITFFGVQRFFFEQPTLSQICFWLEILEEKENRYTGFRYSVRDPEQDCVVRFECSDFIVESTEMDS